MTWDETLEKLRSFCDYQDDFDGEGTAAPSKIALVNAAEYIGSSKNCTPPDIICVDHDSCVAMQWNRKSWFAEVIINADGTITSYEEMK